LGGPTLQNQGTLFKEFRYNIGPTGHYNAHAAALTGVYNPNSINLKQSPTSPTIFEYYRKHNTPTMSPLNSWWVSDSLGPYPLLNYSSDSAYGAAYGANYIQPLSLISQAGYNVLGNSKTFTPTETTSANKIRNILDNNFSNQFSSGDAGIENLGPDKGPVENFIKNSLNDAIAGLYNDPWGVGGGIMNGDMFNIFFAEKIIQEFQPELTVVNIQGIDVCHSNYTAYCNNIKKADYALAHLWQTIQSTPGMANDTVLIAVPEHGRNLSENTLIDQFGRYALDHTNEAMARELFCLVLGPSGVVQQAQEITQVTGESIDVVPTIANVLGFYDDIPIGYKNSMGSHLSQAFI
jgi:hypothetical protein